MSLDDIRNRTLDIRRRLNQIKDSLDADSLIQQRRQIEERMASDGFWSNQESAKTTVTELKHLKVRLDPLTKMERSLEELELTLELVAEDPTEANVAYAETLARTVEKAMAAFEFRVMLGGEYDSRSAFLSVQAGAGGTESCDWAAMLLRMYARWAERQGYEVEIIDRLDGEEAGIKSATVLVKGDWAYGYLRAEAGVHRLVRLSPFDSQNRRQTSFAAVEVSPEIEDAEAMEIRAEDLRVDTYRAGGAGGQHVNKTDSAIRLTHIPTGLVVSCQSERSQHKNRNTAMKMLTAKLVARAESERDATLKGLQGEQTDIGWGHQIRSYVLHPYQMVKDHRTDHETGNTAAVLDGDIQEFIETYLRSRK
ncbi:MAG TPA: peptide chain release factor 2 [Planctomycetota bacterium]|nr:peptide chain release factor 2 [Planctomycetota bacterium]